MASRGRVWLFPLLLLLGACNMAISETPIFAATDAAVLSPRLGVWVADDPECTFDSTLPEAQWPQCAMWLVVEGPGQVMLLDGKGQSQQARYVIAPGTPPIVQILWRDDAKDDGKTFYVFFGIEPDRPDGEFLAASSWEVKCGDKDPSGSDIKPFPGISPECRPLSQDAIRSAAVASRAGAEMAMRWRWVRATGDQPTISSGLKK